MGIWDKPLILALGILTLALGRFSILEKIITGLCIGVFFFYYIYRGRKGFKKQLAVKNLMGLFPGNLLLLLGISTMESYSSYLLWAWLGLIPGIMFFDLFANRGKINSKSEKLVLGGFYLFVWADIFFLIYMWITIGGRISPEIKGYFSWGIGVIGAVFLSIGFYRFATLKLARRE